MKKRKLNFSGTSVSLVYITPDTDINGEIKLTVYIFASIRNS